MLGERFLLLQHIGRKSGLSRQNVLEVVRHDKASDTYYVASGWGDKSDWFRNVRKTPEVVIQVGGRRLEAVARLLPPEEAEREMLDYALRHSFAIDSLARFMGYHLEGTEDDYRALGRIVPIIAIQPRRLQQ